MKRNFKHKNGSIAEFSISTGNYYITKNKFSLGYWDKTFIENSNDWQEIQDIPEYAKCIDKVKDCTIGKIYKVIEFSSSGYFRWEDDKNFNGAMWPHSFEASTKEEYDNQNKPKLDYYILSIVYGIDAYNENYIKVENKPCLSSKDVLDYLENFFPELIKLVKSKL